MSTLLRGQKLRKFVFLMYAVPVFLPILESEARVTHMCTHQVVAIGDAVKYGQASSFPDGV